MLIVDLSGLVGGSGRDKLIIRRDTNAVDVLLVRLGRKRHRELLFARFGGVTHSPQLYGSINTTRDEEIE